MNTDRLQVLYDTVTQEEHRDRLVMRDWVTPRRGYTPPETISKDNLCGTALCFAGWAIVLFDGPLLLVRDNDTDPDAWRYVPASDLRASIPERAALLLGLDPEQAWHLFGAFQGNALAMLQSMIDANKEVQS